MGNKGAAVAWRPMTRSCNPESTGLSQGFVGESIQYTTFVKIHRDIFSLWQPLQKGAAEKKAWEAMLIYSKDIVVVRNDVDKRIEEYITAHTVSEWDMQNLIKCLIKSVSKNWTL